MMTMWGLEVRLENLYFATFRKPTSTSVILTYSMPPYTTIRGMLSNAIGLPRDDLRLQDWFKIGIKPIMAKKGGREISKILKLKGSGKKYERFFPSAPMFREFLVQSVYVIYLLGDKEKINLVHLALSRPKRPLYLGSSDELMDLEVNGPQEVQMAKVDEVSSIMEGFFEGCLIERVPYRFLKRRQTIEIEYKVISTPQKYPLKLPNSVEAFIYNGDKKIWAV